MLQERMDEKIKNFQDFYTAINGKWKLQILVSANHGASRSKEIQPNIPKITSRVLSKELNDLEANHMITRTVYDTISVTIEYKATQYSLTIEPITER